MPLVVRDSVPADDAQLGELLIRAFVDTYARKMPEVQVSDRRKAELRDVGSKRVGGRVWVAELDGKIVGTVSVWDPGAKGSEAWIPGSADLRQLVVEPSLHGQGIAGKILDVVEAEVWNSGVTSISLHVRRGADGLHRFYEKRGYVRTPEGDLNLLPEIFLEARVLRR